MYTVNNSIIEQPFNKLVINKLTSDANLDVLSISLEKGSIFPEHTSPREATLIMLEGEMEFHIKNKSFKLTKNQHFQFEKEVAHWVKALENSKFLIIR